MDRLTEEQRYLCENLYCTKLPQPFRKERKALRDELWAVISSEAPQEEKDLQYERINKEIKAVDDRALVAMGGFEEVEKHFRQVDDKGKLRRYIKKEIKNSESIGIDPSVAITRQDSKLIADVLFSKRQVEKFFPEPIAGFTSETESRFEQNFDRFLELSSQLSSNTPNATLTAEITRLEETFHQKKQEVSSYNEQLSEFYSRFQTHSSKKLEVSCKAHCSIGPVEVGFGPLIKVERGVPFSKSSIGFNLDFNFDHSNTNRESGIEVLLAANKGSLEAGVGSNFSNSGTEYALTGQINHLDSFTGGLQLKSKSLKELLHPVTAVKNTRAFFGWTLKRGSSKSRIRGSFSPFDEIENFVGFECNQTDFNSNSLKSNDQNQIESLLRQAESEVNLSLNEVQSAGQQDNLENEEGTSLADFEKEFSEQSENLEISKQENKEITSFAEANAFRRANQVAMSIPPASLPPGSVGTIGTSQPFSNFLAVGLLALGGVVGFFTLVYKFKNRNND